MRWVKFEAGCGVGDGGEERRYVVSVWGGGVCVETWWWIDRMVVTRRG